MGDFSKELCGGTHVANTADIQRFKIKSESGVASGIRRIEAITADEVKIYERDEQRRAHEKIAALQKQLAKKTDDILVAEAQAGIDNAAAVLMPETLDELMALDVILKKRLSRAKSKSATQAGASLADEAIEVNGVFVLAHALEQADTKILRETMDQLKDKLQHAVIVLAAVNNNNVQLIAGVTKSETQKIKAGDLVNHVAGFVGGRGGGRPEMAQAGGDNAAALPEALASVYDWAKKRL